MPSDLLTPEARRENAAALAAALGLTLDAASKALDVSVAITADADDRGAQQVATEVSALLCRTVERVSSVQPTGTISAELVIGMAVPQTAAPKVFLQLKEDRLLISRERLDALVCASIPEIIGLIAACYASAAVLYRALGDGLSLEFPDPFVFPFQQLGIDFTGLRQPVDIGHTYLAGAGAIGNGFLWASRHLNLRGRLEIADDDRVSSGNLNRQIWFNVEDIGSGKAECLVRKAQPLFKGLDLVPRPARLQDLPEKSDGPWLRRLVVAVDSRRARRQLQNEFPGEVFDASTTDIREVVLHHHLEPTQNACLSCIYEPEAEEFSRERHIAEHLGVSVEEVRGERISAAAAASIANKFLSLVADELVGTSYDSLFKALCGESLLQTPAGKAVLAPLAFVSVLAGALLALEIVRRLGSGEHAREFNYWRVSPWHPPLGRRRILRPKQRQCTFCANPLLSAVNNALWKT